MLNQSQQRHARGLTLIELMVGLTIMAFLLASGVPSLMVWVRNAQIRATSESILNGLHHARAEAVKRNTSVRFQLTSTLDNNCAASTSGTNWVINVGATTTTNSLCGTAPSDTTAPLIVTKSVASSNTGIAISATSAQTAIAFDGFGRQTTTTSPATAVSTYTVTIQPASGGCLTSTGTGTYRCLTIQVTPSGLPRLCDPAMSGSTTTSATSCLS